MNLKDLIIEENENFIAVNKPAGLIVNKAQTAKSITLQDLTEKYLESALSEYDIDALEPHSIHYEFVSRGGIVHRLDKDTSGTILVAKSAEAFEELKQWFLKRKVKKTYYAVVWGDVTKLLGSHEYIEVNLPIARNPNNRHKYAIVKSGRPALSKVYPSIPKDIDSSFSGTCVTEFDKKIFSLVKVQPKTGRTHQIRIHLKALNHEIAGDSIYNGKKQLAFCKKHSISLMLHAYSLKFKAFENTYELKSDFTKDYLDTLKMLYNTK